MRHTAVVLALAALCLGPGASRLRAQAPVQAKAPAQASFFSHGDMETIWKDLEARKVINKRVLEGGDHSVNIRIVTDDAPPLVHATTVDVWVVIEGTAVATTGGRLAEPKKTANADDLGGSAIQNGTDRPIGPGDVVFIPPGVPHGFKEMKGFHAVLIRFEPK